METGKCRVKDKIGQLEGCLLGSAVGDALGLPREGLTPERARKLFGEAPLRHQFFFGRGMISDDTEHACMTAQSLLTARGDVDRFSHSLAWRLRGWLLGLPAGVGFATLRAIIKLWLSWPPARSGVRSAGNGPAMRAPVLGAYAADDLDLLKRLVQASTALTHTDPRAEQGALAIALAARQGMLHGPVDDPAGVIASLLSCVSDPDLRRNLALIESHLDAAAGDFAAALGLTHGVSGYINHTVPVALFCWLRYPADFRQAMEEAILLGGDADTVGAIVGGLMGCTLGAQAIPTEWLNGLAEWPRSVNWMRRLAERLAENGKPLPLCWPGLLPRNLLFLVVVLWHGVRRLLPPY